MDWMKIVDSFGLAGLFGIAFVTLMFFTIKWTLNFVGKLINQYNTDRENWLKQASIDRENWVKAVDRQSDAWNTHTQQATIFHELVQEAHKYQREEHQRLEAALNTTCSSLKQVETALGRINGYTDHH
jgi:hypothetical protein